MARLVGVDLPRDKRIEVGLTYIYGIGLTTSKKILAETGVDPSVRVKDLTEDDLTKLRDYIHGDRLLSWTPSSSRPARSRTAHAHECAHAQGSS